MSVFLWAAAGVSAATFCLHTFLGGRDVARPLLADTNLPRESKWLNYYCWHITSVMIAFIAAAFAWLASTDARLPEIVFLSALTGTLSVLSVWVAVKAGINPLRFPSTSLFAVISALGWLAVLT